jgi:hypothetical protein
MPESMRLQYIDSPGREIGRKNYKKLRGYDYQKAYFLCDTSGLTGSDLEDKLLQDVLLYSCTDTVIHQVTKIGAYSDPIPAEAVTVESHSTYAFTEPAPTPLTEPAPAPTPETTHWDNSEPTLGQLWSQLL